MWYQIHRQAWEICRRHHHHNYGYYSTYYYIYIYTLFLPLFVLLPYRRYHYDFYKLFVRSHCSALQDAALSDPDMWICVRERTGRLIDLFWDDLTLYLESMVFDAKDSLGRWGWGGLHLSHLLDGW